MCRGQKSQTDAGKNDCAELREVGENRKILENNFLREGTEIDDEKHQLPVKRRRGNIIFSRKKRRSIVLRVYCRDRKKWRNTARISVWYRLRFYWRLNFSFFFFFFFIYKGCPKTGAHSLRVDL